MDKYQILCQIGKGACGAVFLVKDENDDNKKLYALKKIQLDESRKTRTKEAVQREAKILSCLKHPHIVAYHDSFFDEDQIHLCIIQDYCDGGTLDDRIKDASQRKEFFPEKQILQWFLQVALAVRYMHSQKVLHRDLKAQNIFMNKSGTLCKLGDFGIAKSMDTDIDVASTCVGTPCYLSPEMCQDIPYSSKSDIWAMGCMLYEMTTLKPAFDAFNLVSLFYKIVKGEYEPIPSIFSEDLADLIRVVLTKCPDQRPSASGILAIPFVRQELQNFIEEKEFLLLNRRLPTRQGSRPYSTPSLSRGVGQESNSNSTEAQQNATNQGQPRAISCRPNLHSNAPSNGTTNQPASNYGVRPPGRSGRVSTIPEETEDQLLERSLRTLDGQLLLPKLDEESSSPPHKSNHSELCPKSNSAMNEALQKTKSRPVSIQKASPTKTPPKESPSQSKRPSSAQHSVTSEVSTSSRRPSSSSYDSRKKQKNSPERPKASEGDIVLPPLPGHDAKNAHRIITLEASEVSEPSEVTLTPRSVATTPRRDVPKLSLEEDAPRYIQAPQRTPRFQEPHPLVIQFEAPREGKPSPRPKRSSGRSGRRMSGRTGEGLWSIKVSSGRKFSSKSSDTRPTTRESSIAGGDYYSDDFDDTDTSSGSDCEDDIPEEISYGPQRSIRAHSLSQTLAADVDSDLEIPEIEEDLPGGLEADDDDDFLRDMDPVDEEISEELDEVVIEARRALESADLREDFISDERRPNTSKFIRNHCIDALGKEKFEKVRKYCENNNSPEIKKLERMVGKEHAKTVYLMAEISRPQRR